MAIKHVKSFNSILSNGEVGANTIEDRDTVRYAYKTH